MDNSAPLCLFLPSSDILKGSDIPRCAPGHEIYVLSFLLLQWHSHRLWHIADISSDTFSREKKNHQNTEKKLFLCPKTTIWALRKYWTEPPYGRHTPLQSSSVNTSQLVLSVLGMEIISQCSRNARCATSLTLRQMMGLHLFYLSVISETSNLGGPKKYPMVAKRACEPTQLN